MKENILITAIGSYSADIVIESLKHNYVLYGTDIYEKECIAVADNVDYFFNISRADSENYFDDIKEICINNNIRYILPLTDPEIDVLNENRGWFNENNIILLFSKYEVINLTRNKKALADYILKNNKNNAIKSIPTINYYFNSDISLGFPIVAKPRNGRSSEGLYIINDEDEWKALRTKLDSNYILQPFIRGKNITVDIINNPNEKKTIAIPREELIRTINGAGVSVKLFRDKMLEESCIEIAKCIGVTGCVNFEFILDDNGIYYFLECNPRFSGGISFSCTTGYDCINNHIRCFKGENIDSYISEKTYYIARKYNDYVTKVL